jgi:hypothetical protein
MSYYDMGAGSPTAVGIILFTQCTDSKRFGGKYLRTVWDYPVQIKEYKAFRHYESLSDATNPFLTRREGL